MWYNNSMKNTDLRTQTKEARKAMKRVAIRMFKRNRNKSKIANELGVARNTVNAWILEYEKHGTIQNEKKRGRPKGDGRVLTPDQEKIIQNKIVDKTPDQYKLPFALWTNDAVKKLIEQEFKITIAQRTICDYLHRWGFTPQRPIKLAYEQQPKAVQEWLENTYPKIKKKCEDENGEIHWADETGISSIEHYPRGYAPVGKTPIITLSHASRERVNMISSMNNQGKVQFMIYDDKFTAQVFIIFLEQLIKSSDKKIHLVLDNLRVHHAKIVKTWLENKESKIELHYLPSYSPELNPDEYLNCDLKAKFRNDAPTRKKGEMKDKMQKHMEDIQNQPQRVVSYFKHKKIAYAA